MKVQKHFERQETGFICYFWSISMLLDPELELHSEYGSRDPDQDSLISADPDTQYGLEGYLFPCW
jgi:hypothetical protein